MFYVNKKSTTYMQRLFRNTLRKVPPGRNQIYVLYKEFSGAGYLCKARVPAGRR
jgi:hypothetical protein